MDASRIRTHRPAVSGSRHMAAAGHAGAAHAAFSILEAGGNAVDAGVAAGIALGVLQSDIVNVAGVAPILIYSAERDQVVSIAGLGPWPRAASAAYFREAHDGLIPPGIRRTVVPAAPAAWIAALAEFGTRSFAEVAAPAIRFAREGFAMHALMAENIAKHEAGFRRWPSNAAIYLPGGAIPRVGDLFVQSDLARTLQFMCDEEGAAAAGGRAAGLAAARAAFYRGDIAAAIVRFQQENDGWLDAADLAAFEAGIEPAVQSRYKDYELYTNPPWCQGPLLLQVCRLIEEIDLAGLGHNSVRYIHVLTEALKIAFADRERLYGDPRFVDVPLRRLLSSEYAELCRRGIRPDAAAPAPPHADGFRQPPDGDRPDSWPDSWGAVDTSYVCVVDRHGNAFSATPSDTSSSSPLVPGTGLVPSMRGSQSWASADHPSVLAPGKRPRLTPSPALAIRRGGDGQRELLPFGSPGGDVQLQAMLQVFLNVVEFGMDAQAAVECPRFATFSFPDSFQPHAYTPGRLNLEARLAEAAGPELARLGHEVETWPDWTSRAGGVCAIRTEPATGLMQAGADPRRPSYALGW